jgi:hypothetical protein
MDWVKSQWDGFIGEFKGMNARQLIGQGVNLGESVAHDHAVCRTNSAASRSTGSQLDLRHAGLVVTSALIIWKSLMLITGSESPVSNSSSSCNPLLSATRRTTAAARSCLQQLQQEHNARQQGEL